MECLNCGQKFPDDAKFCPACGTQVTGADLISDSLLTAGRDFARLRA